MPTEPTRKTTFWTTLLFLDGMENVLSPKDAAN